MFIVHVEWAQGILVDSDLYQISGWVNRLARNAREVLRKGVRSHQDMFYVVHGTEGSSLPAMILSEVEQCLDIEARVTITRHDGGGTYTIFNYTDRVDVHGVDGILLTSHSKDGENSATLFREIVLAALD